jgi:hypothetical protein
LGLALVMLGCGADVDPCEFEVLDTIEAGEGCLRLDVVSDDNRVRLAGESCAEWVSCLTLQPGELAEGGSLRWGTPDAQIAVSAWECSAMPPCGVQMNPAWWD